MRRLICITMIALLSVSQAAEAEGFNRPMKRLSKSLQLPERTVASANVKVLSEGRVIAPEQVTDALDQQKAAVVERTGTELRELPAGSIAADQTLKPLAAYALPVSFRAFAVDPGGANPRPVDFQPMVLVMSAMRYREESRRFEVDLMVGLRNSEDPKDQSMLAEARRLFVSADADVTPKELQITRLGDPVAVKVTSISPAAPLKVIARTMVDDGDTIDVPVIRPSLTIDTSRASINGLGLEKTTIHVQAEGLADMSNMHVFIKTSAGDVKPSEVTLSADGRGTAEIRSAGFGPVQLSASGVPFALATSSMNFAKPWSFLVAMVLGAIAGWLIRNSARSRSLGSFLLALASAMVVTAAFSVGIRLAQWAPEATVGEALTFFVAAIGAWGGIKVITALKAQAA
jgi:hypothetical protein